MSEKIKVLLSEEEVDARIRKIAEQISKDYAGKEIHLICVLKGGVFFTCELAKRITVPVIMQMEALECGAASLAMILAYHGKWLPLEQVRSDCGVSRDGSKASNIAKAGRSYGLEVKAHRYGVDEVKENVTYPAIIHWNFNHFVVLCGFTKNAAVINDPARGTIKVTIEEFDHSFTGVCIEFTPGENFEKGGKPESVFKFLKDRLANTTASVIFVMITAALVAFVGLVTPVFARIFTDQILPGHNMHWLEMLLVAMLFTAIFRMIVGFLNEIYLYRIKGKLAIVSNASFMWHMLHLPMDFYAQRMVGDLAGRQKLNDQIAETLIAKYVLVETKAPEGYVRSEKEESVIFAYEDGNTKEIEITKELTNERIPTGGYSNSPKTEDDTNIWLPFFLLLLSVGGIAGIIWYTKRKNHD